MPVLYWLVGPLVRIYIFTWRQRLLADVLALLSFLTALWSFFGRNRVLKPNGASLIPVNIIGEDALNFDSASPAHNIKAFHSWSASLCRSVTSNTHNTKSSKPPKQTFLPLLMKTKQLARCSAAYLWPVQMKLLFKCSPNRLFGVQSTPASTSSAHCQRPV